MSAANVAAAKVAAAKVSAANVAAPWWGMAVTESLLLGGKWRKQKITRIFLK
jgi:hypothetical protein